VKNYFTTGDEQNRAHNITKVNMKGKVVPVNNHPAEIEYR